MKEVVSGLLVAAVLAVALIWLLGSPPAGGSTPAQTPPKSDPGAEGGPGKAGQEEFAVALITPGPVNDGGWSENAYKGLQLIGKELGARTANAVAKDSVEAYETFRGYGDGRYRLVIGHAGEWHDPKLVEIARASPGTQFLVSGCEKDRDGNVAGVRFVLEDACYVLGFLAGQLSRSGVLGCVGPKQHPVIESTFFAFANGAKAARPDADVRIVWTQSWDDVAKAKEQTLSLIANKADLIFHNANNGGPGVFEAVREKKELGILAFGANDDQTALAPEVVLASAVLDIPKVFLDVARQVKEGRFDGKTRTLGLAEGYVWVAYNKDLAARIPAEVRKKTDEITESIRAGSLKVERRVLK